MTAPFSFFVSSSPGIERFLHAELVALGALSPQIVAGGVDARGHRRSIYRVLLESGLGTHLFLRVGSFVAERFDHFEQGIRALPWESFLRPGVPRELRSSTHKSRLHHTGALEERAAAAIAARLGDGLDTSQRDGVPIRIRLERDRVLGSIDLAGAPMHRRGYRQAVSRAPLREDLARALIVAAEWDPATPLVDPFCGAGTFAIEAATIARRLAPGRLRTFAIERTVLHHEPTWEEVKSASAERSLARAPSAIVASDIDARAIDAARSNAIHAGVDGDLEIVVASISELDLRELAREPRGLIVANPPHGHRLGDRDSLAPLYRALGRRVRELPPGWRLAVIAADRRLGLLASEKLKTLFLTDSGGIKVRGLVEPR